MSLVVVIPNNIYILEALRLLIDTHVYLISNSTQGTICYYQHHGVIWLLNFMNMEVLAIRYYSNGISITYLLPRIGSMYRAK